MVQLVMAGIANGHEITRGFAAADWVMKMMDLGGSIAVAAFANSLGAVANYLPA